MLDIYNQRIDSLTARYEAAIDYTAREPTRRLKDRGDHG
jgi:hypothetical protein